VLPSVETVKNGTYAPLARPIFIYVTDVAAKKPEVANFVNFYLTSAPKLVPDVGYIPLSGEEYQAEISKFQSFIEAK
jgi:phosphate transport system substrate-binding protein